MQLSTITLFYLTAIVAAFPVEKRQGAAAIFATTTYDEISISGGTAGNGEAEALAVFSALDSADPATLSKDDLDFLNEVNQVANDAETDAFNPAVEAATGAEADALQVRRFHLSTPWCVCAGKIKNKILKLEATVLKLQAQQAQGEDVATKLADEQKKLDNNIATDKKNAGKPSTALPFDATI
ncbi:hypothetical protein P280DRAFT_366186, partial [Massarina eburnea CBS 473.64]